MGYLCETCKLDGLNLPSCFSHDRVNDCIDYTEDVSNGCGWICSECSHRRPELNWRCEEELAMQATFIGQTTYKKECQLFRQRNRDQQEPVLEETDPEQDTHAEDTYPEFTEEDMDPANENDAVNRPAHYIGQIECIDYLRDKLTPAEFTGFCTGNVIKYVSRWRKKGGVQDLKKAAVYLQWAIEHWEAHA